MDPYKILDVSQDATNEEIERAYRKKATKYHPDMGGEAWAFQQVQEAYAKILRDRGAKPREGEKSQSSAQQPFEASAHRSKNAPPSHQQTRRASESQPSGVKPHDPGPGQSSTDASSYRRPDFSEKRSLGQWLWRAAFEQLPMQNETTVFILVGALDIFMTYVLMRYGAIEANPFANYFFRHWGFDGLIFFKMGMVAFVTVLAQAIARFDVKTASRLLQVGSVIVGIVVAYSVLLFGQHFQFKNLYAN